MAKKKTPRKKQASRKATENRPTAKSHASRKTSTSVRSGEQRLQRVLASAGIGSRRECETLIEEGRVEVDGKFVTKLGAKVDPAQCKIRVDGAPIKLQSLQYFAVNKPPGVVSTSRDPSGRLRVIDLIKTNQRVYNVGRLDKSSEGLILVTNDGDLANRLTHPRYRVQKTYLVQVVGHPARSDLKTLERGVYLAEGLAKVVGARIKSRGKDNTMLEIILEEGRNREIRRLLASIGHKVQRLRRVAIGSLRLGELPLGAHRSLEKREIDALKRVAENPQAKKSGQRSSRIKRTSKRKPKVGEEGWTIKSGGKPRKKKYTKKQSAERQAEREERTSGRGKEASSKKTSSKKAFKKKSTSKNRTSTSRSAGPSGAAKGRSRGKSAKPSGSQGRGKARAAAKSATRTTKKSSKRATKKSVARGKSKRR